jgi:hypothetical protein
MITRRTNPRKPLRYANFSILADEVISASVLERVFAEIDKMKPEEPKCPKTINSPSSDS